jgi:hypothetical protein
LTHQFHPPALDQTPEEVGSRTFRLTLAVWGGAVSLLLLVFGFPFAVIAAAFLSFWVCELTL